MPFYKRIGWQSSDPDALLRKGVHQERSFLVPEGLGKPGSGARLVAPDLLVEPSE